jgi:hypothetical protein
VVGDGGSIQANFGPNLILGHTRPIDQIPIALSLLHGVQVLSLEVLHQRQLEGPDFINTLYHPHRYLSQARQSGRTPPALASDDPKAIALSTNANWLKEAVLRNTLAEGLHGLTGKDLPGLVRVRINSLDRHNSQLSGF